MIVALTIIAILVIALFVSSAAEAYYKGRKRKRSRRPYNHALDMTAEQADVWTLTVYQIRSWPTTYECDPMEWVS